MEAKDLRIGNLVNIIDRSGQIHLPNVITYIVHEISLGDVSLLMLGLNLWSNDLFKVSHFDVSPIPLTEEWLLKFGFKPIPHMTVMNSFTLDIGRDRVISIGCVGTPNEMIFLIEDYSNRVPSQDICVLRNFDYDGITYVHTLQNIVFAITGKELVYNA